MWKKHIQKTKLWEIISPLYYKYIYPLYNYTGTIYYKVENYICRKKYKKEFCEKRNCKRSHFKIKFARGG